MKIIKLAGLLVLWGSCMPSFSQTVSTIAGPMSGSGGILVDKDGSVLVADYGDALTNANGHTMRRVDLNGNISIHSTGFQGASGNTFGPDGRIYQCNIAGNFISKIKPNGTAVTYASQGLSSPVGIVADTAGNFYVANCGDNTVRKIASDVSSTQFSADPLFNCPNGITLDDEGNLYVSNFNDGNIIKIDENGTASLFSYIPGDNNGHLKYSSVHDALFVTSHGSSSIYRVQMDGSVVAFAGSGWRGNVDGPAASASFSRPNGIDFSKTHDTLYVNTAVPLHNNGVPLNPSLVRMVTGVSLFTGTEDKIDEASFEVYPNPVQEYAAIRFEAPSSGVIKIQLVDPLGNQIHLNEVRDYSSGLNQIEVSIPSNIDPGVYILSFRGEGVSMNKRIIVQ